MNLCAEPKTCGQRGKESRDIAVSGAENIISMFPNLLSLWYNAKWKTDSLSYQQGHRWWDLPEPVFNTFYFGKIIEHFLYSIVNLLFWKPVTHKN